jgi:hypothetical protein
MAHAPAWQGQAAGLGAALHLAVDTTTGKILAHEMTPREHHDGPELPGLLTQIEASLAVVCADGVCADGVCDSFNSHAVNLARGATPVIPLRKGAAISPPRGMKDQPPIRGEAVRRIIEIGRTEWKKEAGYHRRSLAETAMFRYKAIICPNLRSRNLATQKTEAAVGLRCLNQLTGFGIPTSIKIA